MKTLFSIFALNLMVIFSLQSQSVSNYSYKLDNGINVKTESCWNQVWVQQTYQEIKAGDKTPPLEVNIRALGDLISSSAYKLLSGEKEFKMQGAVAGTYQLKLTFKLSGKPGILSLVANNIIIKPKTKTFVSVTLYDYQILIDESPEAIKGLSNYECKVNRYKGNTEQNLNVGVPTFFAKGNHDKPIPPEVTTTNTSGKIKPGTYDILISIGIAGHTQKVWLENFLIKPDINYKITTNLNAGTITYTGGNKDVKIMQLYPAGTADRQTGTPAPIKNLEIIDYENVTLTTACPPGAYDVLLNYGKGKKYEWKKNIFIKSGYKTEVK